MGQAGKKRIQEAIASDIVCVCVCVRQYQRHQQILEPDQRDSLEVQFEKYNIIMTRKRMQVTILLSWIIAITFGVTTSVADSRTSRRIEIVFMIIAVVYVLVTVFTYIRIMQQIKR